MRKRYTNTWNMDMKDTCNKFVISSFLITHYTLTKVSNGSVVISRFEQHGKGIGFVIFGLEGDSILISQHLEDFIHIGSADSQRVRTIATEVLECFGPKANSNQRHMSRIHALDSNLLFTAVEIAITNKVLDGLNDMFEGLAFGKLSFEHG